MSLMRAHQAKFEKGQPVKVGNAGPGGKGTVNKGQLMQLLDTGLQVALTALHALKSKSDKNNHKRDHLIPDFSEYVNRLMDKGWVHDLLPWYMVWCLDAGQMAPALNVARYCMKKGLELDKDAFVRDIPSFVADEIHKWAEDAFKDGHSAEPYFSEVYDLVIHSGGTDPWAQHDEVRAKFFKLKGLMEYQAGNLEAARDNFEKGLALGATVKTVLAEVTKKLEDAGDTPDDFEDDAK
ncbi:phage terminase small subunit [Pseudodesulfovibrio sp.]|uniref:phage terminase small subunit n=1 Tax=unclassified Pseudodesulfovibrio TaxID=2661612 RepID=UPI003B0062B8